MTWLVQDAFVDAVRAHPAVDEVLPFPRAAWRRWWRPSMLRHVQQWLGGLRGRFDLVVDAQGLGRSGLMAWSTRAPRRIGYRNARELGWLGLNERFDVPHVHAVDRMLGLLESAGVPPIADLTLYVPSGAESWWQAERHHRGVSRYAVFAPTSRWPSKAWPAECWRALAPRLLERGFSQIVYLGAPNEVDDVARALPGAEWDHGVVNLAGGTTVGQSMAVVKDAHLVIGNDSAPIHMAVGFDRPLLAIYGPTNVARVGPYRREASVLQSADARNFSGSYRDRGLGDRLMRGIRVDDVVAAFDAGRAAAGVRA